VIAPIVIVVVSTAVVLIIAVAVVIAEIPVVVMVPAVIVFHPAVFTFPIAVVEPLAVMMRPDPASAFIWRPAPVALMPFIVVSHRIPIALDPYEFGTRGWRQNVNDARWWGRANLDANRNLCSQSRYAAQ
jgi:hypothetical protein